MAAPSIARASAAHPQPEVLDRGRLVVQAPHAVELPHLLTGFVSARGGQVSDLKWSFTDDTLRDRVVYRIEFQAPELEAELPSLRTEFAAEVAERFGAEFRFAAEADKTRVAIMVSRARHGHCLRELLHKRDQLPLEIAHVISNHDELRAEVEAYGIDYTYIPVTRGDKAPAERKQLALIAELDVQLVVLARYMQILSKDFLEQVGIRDYGHQPNQQPVPVINIHHGLLPAFPGARPYNQARRHGVKVAGATAHYATAVLDAGPIIEQDTFRIETGDTEADLERKGADRERDVLLRAVQWHCEDRVFHFGDNQTVVL